MPRSIRALRTFPFLTLTSALLLAGCSSGLNGGNGDGTAPGQTTRVTVMLSSSANSFPMGIETYMSSLRLVPQSGAPVELVSAQQQFDAVSAQGPEQPLLTVDVPQGVYPTAAFDDSQTLLSWITFSNSLLVDNQYEIKGDGTPFNPTVTLSSPITISGSTMTLRLTMDGKSSLFPIYTNPATPYGVAERFTLAPETTLSPIANVVAQVTSTSANGLTVTTMDGARLQVSTNMQTEFDGVSSVTTLANNNTIELSGQPNADGSVAASRIQLLDTTGPELLTGPVGIVDATSGLFYVQATQSMGPDNASAGVIPSLITGAVYKISSGFSNLGSLPFTARFDAASMYAGQNVAAVVPNIPLGAPFPAPSSVTLLPQIINGTIASVTSSGSFTVYSVSLDPQGSLAAILSHANAANTGVVPQNVVVYTDSSTVNQDAFALQTGNTVRFHGLLFNDSGTLRMDSDMVLTGVS